MRKTYHWKVLVACLFAAGASAAAAPEAATQQGRVRGEVVGATLAFRGIPYAAPPVGALRFRPPAPAAPWTGVRDALSFGSPCPQAASPLTRDLKAWNEDCLTLNVWTPGKPPAPKLPVMVWIHGGGLGIGSSSQGSYDGQHLAGHGVVLVSINYRLGLLGLLAHPGLSAEDSHHVSGNYGLLDQIAALQWVKVNISGFGGDPANVTIFGESAGGESVCTLMASPLAAALFTKAIIQSGGCVPLGQALHPLRDAGTGAIETAEAQGVRLGHSLGCDGAGAESVACLRSKSAGDLLSLAKAKVGFFGPGEKYGFTLDGWALAQAPKSLLDAGKLAKVPVMIGTNADEGTLFAPHLKREVGFQIFIKKIFGAGAEAVLAQYPVGPQLSPAAAAAAVTGDVAFTCSARQAARALRQVQPGVYRYEFARAPSWLPAGLGATHGSELQFVFETVPSGKGTDEERQLAHAMATYWTSFAKTGHPSAPGQPEWAAYDAAKDSYLRLDVPVTAASGLRTQACDVLDAHPVNPLPYKPEE